MPFDGGADQLRDEHGLADTGAAEHRRLPAFYKRRKQINHLDAGMENLKRRIQAIDRRGWRVNRLALDVGGKRRPTIGGLAGDVEEPPEHSVADGHTNGGTGGACPCAAAQSNGAFECHSAHGYRIEVLMHLCNELAAFAALDGNAFIDRR
jgi:hypothetical protein